jgi:hypothetical protein
VITDICIGFSAYSIWFSAERYMELILPGFVIMDYVRGPHT